MYILEEKKREEKKDRIYYTWNRIRKLERGVVSNLFSPSTTSSTHNSSTETLTPVVPSKYHGVNNIHGSEK
jgi:hypothetical protein